MSDIATTYIVIVDDKAYTIDFAKMEAKVGTRVVGTVAIDTTKRTPKTTSEYIEAELLHMTIDGSDGVFDMETNEFYSILTDGNTIQKMGELLIQPLVEQRKDEIDIVEVLFAEDARYLHNYSNNGVYDGKTLKYISPFNSFGGKQSKEISRGFINKKNSCYMDSVIFALTYRDSPFLNKYIFDVNPSDISPDSDPTIAAAIESNQKMLRDIRSWLRDIRQQKNSDVMPICTEFRKKYKSIRPMGDGEYEILHDKKWDGTMEDSGDFLLDLLNTFQIRTLREVMSKTGFGKNKAGYEYAVRRTDVPPFIVVPYDISTEHYYRRMSVSSVRNGNTVRQYVFKAITNSDEGREKNRALYREFLDKRLDLLMKFLNKHTDDILPASSLAVFKKEIQALNTSAANYNTSNDFMDRIVEQIGKDPDLKAEFNAYAPYSSLMKKSQNNIIRFEDVITYEPIMSKADDPANSLLIFNVDRSKLGDMTVHKGQKISFDIQETIQGPAGNLLSIQFIVVREGMHYYCVFKNVQDGNWYIYDDMKPRFEKIGIFSKLPKKIYTHCTLLFYGTA